MRIERQLQGTLTSIFTELIKEKGLEDRILPYPVIEEGRADITLKNKSGRPIFFIELKDPTSKDGRSVFDANILMREVERAQRLDIRYFGNCNFLACAFFDKDKLYEKVSVNEGFFSLTDLGRLSRNYSPSKEITSKLRNIGEFYLERALEILEHKPIKFADLDELFIFKIRKLIEVYAPPISESVWKKFQSSKEFKKEVQKYFGSQLWNIPTTFEEIENLTHISVLMLISKLIFYKTYVDNQTWHALHPMKVGDKNITSSDLEGLIWKYFEEFQEVTGNFELLIGNRGDIIFKIPFVSEAVIELVNEVLETEHRYDFSKIPFDIIGRIFEELIREDERHKLGQYFTPSNVIDLINSFAIRNSSDTVFDPSCGSGTFLVRAYQRKKILADENDKALEHRVLLDEIYGNDLSGYPAYLSMLNLAIRNTSKPSYPRIINKDFFSLLENTELKLHNYLGKEEIRKLPKFDAIIGNPPYTRQEDIGTMHGTIGKAKIQALIKAECGFEPSQRTSIYSYFFYHSTAFLKERGYLAFICQNSWLDTDYGIDMQRYLLSNYEIVAIMDSEVERFFPSAAVNTTIVNLRIQPLDSERSNNTVKFIYFTSSLAQTIKEYKGVTNLRTELETIDENKTKEHFRINCINQNSLSKHTKWGQFLKAPKVYFDLLEKSKVPFKPIGNIADEINFGIKTGCNDFFIVSQENSSKDGLLLAAINNKDEFKTLKEAQKEGLALIKNGFNEMWLIEKGFLFPMLTSPKDVGTYSVSPKQLPYSVFTTNKDKKELKQNFPYTYSYIVAAEKKHIHHAATLASRTKWYHLGDKNVPQMSFSYIINDAGKTFLVNAFSNNNFHNIYSKKRAKTIWLYLNSTISWLIQQLIMRVNLGEGAGKIETYDLAAMIMPDINLEKCSIELKDTKNYKEAFGTLESLNTVNSERKKLDLEILEALGFEEKAEREKVLLDLYRSTYKLIDARIQKAQSLKGVKAQRNKVSFTIYVDQLKEILLDDKYTIKNKSSFAKHLKKIVRDISSDIKLQQKILDAYWKEKYGLRFNEKEIAESEQQKLF